MRRDGPPMLTAHLSGIHLLIPMFPLAGPVHDSGQVALSPQESPLPFLLNSLTRPGPHHDHFLSLLPQGI